MKKYFFLFSTLLCSTQLLFAQYQDRFWIMGRANAPANTTNATLDFYPDGLNLYTDPAPPSITPSPDNIGLTNGFEGWGVVTDPESGTLIFYTDGKDVFDANHQVITPAGGLGANPSSSQAVAIAVNPICPFNQYYIFSNPTGVDLDGPSTGPATYRLYTEGSGFSPINSLPGPAGSVIVGEGMVVVPSKTDPFTSWLILRALSPTATGSDYLVYRIDPSGLSFNGTFNFGPPVRESPSFPIMNMAYLDTGGPDEVTVGFTVSRSPRNHLFTNTFNTTTGTFTGPANLLTTFTDGILYDLEFSPGGNFIYYATYFPSLLYQIPINGGSPNLMRNFGQLRAGGLKRGPDGFIYHIYDAGTFENTGTVKIGQLIAPETAFDGTNFNELYAADFNSAVSLAYPNTFAYNFPEFVNTPDWSAEITITGGNPLCPEEEISIIANVNALGQPIDSYSWQVNGTFLIETPENSVTVNQSGNYQVTVNLAGGCTILSDIITIEQDAISIDSVVITASTCAGNSGAVRIIASSDNGTLQYALDDGMFTADNSFVNLSPGNYLVTVTNENGCSISRDVEIPATNQSFTIDTILVVPESCVQADGSLQVVTQGSSGNLLFSINGGNFQPDSNFTGLTAASYSIIVQDENNCSANTMVDLPQIDDGPQINAIETTSESCAGNDGSIIITASSSSGNEVFYSFNNDAFSPSNQLDDIPAGQYLVFVQDNRNCLTETTVEVAEIGNYPSIDAFEVVNPTCNSSNGRIEISAAAGTGSLSYSLDGLNYSSVNSFLDLAADNYTVFVRDELTCTIDTTINVIMGNCPVYIPNTFSPNSDGINDQFQVYANSASTTRIEHYQIYDRWGELIYEAREFLPDAQDQFWDGSFRGQPCPAGIYVYVVTVGLADGTSNIFKDDVLLLR